MNFWKNVKRTLLLWDGIWSIPLAAFFFFAFGWVGETIWGGPDGVGFGMMSPEFIHVAFYASIMIVMLNFITWLGIYFNFRAVFRYYLKESATDFKNLPSWQKISVILFLYSFFFAAGLLIIVTIA